MEGDSALLVKAGRDIEGNTTQMVKAGRDMEGNMTQVKAGKNLVAIVPHRFQSE